MQLLSGGGGASVGSRELRCRAGDTLVLRRTDCTSSSPAESEFAAALPMGAR